MSVFDFPSSPTVGQIYTPAGGPSYIWNGTGWTVTTGPVAVTLRAARNRIVNGAMQISQEYGSTAVSTSGLYPADQWYMVHSGLGGTPQAIRAGTSGSFSFAQSFNAATASPAATAYHQNIQHVEGSRVDDFLWGTANAKQVVLRFDAQSSIPGLYPVVVMNAANDRTFIKGVDLTAVMQTFTIVIPGSTTGVWPTGTAACMSVRFPTVVGANNIGVEGWQDNGKFGLPGMVNGASVANMGISFTNVGLYLDDQNTGVAPRWEMPDEAEELRACQRYWERSWATAVNDYSGTGGFAVLASGTRAITSGRFNVEKRAAPAMSYYDPTNGIANNVWFPGIASGNITSAPGATSKGWGAWMDMAPTGIPVGTSCLYHWIANARM